MLNFPFIQFHFSTIHSMSNEFSYIFIWLDCFKIIFFIDLLIRSKSNILLSLNQKLSGYLENTSNVITNNVPTDPDDLEIVMNKFLSFVKAEFLAEKQRIGY
jgi:hypothetical protein